MKFLVAVFATVVMSACAAPSAYYPAPLAYSAAVYQPVPTSSQWHAQSGLGDYVYGYEGAQSAKSEVKTLDGITQGSYSYVDAESKLQTVNYVADALGFRVAATNLPTPPVYDGKAPEPVEDTPEVKAAKAEHLSTVEKVKNGEAPVATTEAAPLKAPEPVEDTVEVKAAKAEHLKAVEVAKTRSAVVEDVVVAPHSAVEIHAAPVAVQYSAPLSYAAAPVPVAYSAPLAYSAVPVVTVKAEPIKPFSYAVHSGYPYYY
ncbi:cuticle protein 16.8-like [Chironomus tepperi]|uniref:cuticle protein 16.8-like n=1 Tax=Chironomus tepperi TaxID=113505 RepID=UPI00391EF243